MKIGILGAAGAGKSKFAQSLARSLKDEGKVKIVDDVVQKLEDTTGYAYGIFATHVQNHQIAYSRWTAEQVAEHKGYDPVISVGTIYETILWAALFADQRMFQNDLQMHAQSRASLGMLGILESLTDDYDLLFFLPLSDEKVKELGRAYDTVIDAKLMEVLETYFKKAVILKGTQKEKILRATESIRAFQAQQNKPSEDDKPAVRGSGETASEKSEEV